MSNDAPVHSFAQRWRDRREYRRPAEERIVPAEFGVEILRDRDAKAFVTQHHYSGSYPAARLAVGLMRRTGVDQSRLVGVCVFGVPMNERSVPRYIGVEPNRGVELSRLVLLDEVLSDGESWFVARAMSMLRAEKPEVAGVVSYADPTERWDADGNRCKPGHIGVIYQALNFGYFGRGCARTLVLSRDGRVVSQRALSKIRNEERGIDQHYLSINSIEEVARAWVDRALRSDAFVRLKRPGNHVYLLGLDRKTRRHVGTITTTGRKGYPKEWKLAA